MSFEMSFRSISKDIPVGKYGEKAVFGLRIIDSAWKENIRG